jgi:hypothetical protein
MPSPQSHARHAGSNQSNRFAIPQVIHIAGPSGVIWYYTNIFYNKAQSAVGVVAEWVPVYPSRMKCTLAVVTYRDRTSQTFSTDVSVNESEGNAFNASGGLDDRRTCGAQEGIMLPHVR